MEKYAQKIPGGARRQILKKITVLNVSYSSNRLQGMGWVITLYDGEVIKNLIVIILFMRVSGSDSELVIAETTGKIFSNRTRINFLGGGSG